MQAGRKRARCARATAECERGRGGEGARGGRGRVGESARGEACKKCDERKEEKHRACGTAAASPIKNAKPRMNQCWYAVSAAHTAAARRRAAAPRAGGGNAGSTGVSDAAGGSAGASGGGGGSAGCSGSAAAATGASGGGAAMQRAAARQRARPRRCPRCRLTRAMPPPRAAARLQLRRRVPRSRVAQTARRERVCAQQRKVVCAHRLCRCSHSQRAPRLGHHGRPWPADHGPKCVALICAQPQPQRLCACACALRTLTPLPLPRRRPKREARHRPQGADGQHRGGQGARARTQRGSAGTLCRRRHARLRLLTRLRAAALAARPHRLCRTSSVRRWALARCSRCFLMPPAVRRARNTQTRSRRFAAARACADAAPPPRHRADQRRQRHPARDRRVAPGGQGARVALQWLRVRMRCASQLHATDAATAETGAQQSMIELARTQDEEVGDGTTSVIILGAWRRCCCARRVG